MQSGSVGADRDVAVAVGIAASLVLVWCRYSENTLKGELAAAAKISLLYKNWLGHK